MKFDCVADSIEVSRATSFFGNKPEVGENYGFFLIEKDDQGFVVATILEKEKELVEEKYTVEDTNVSSIQRLWIKK